MKSFRRLTSQSGFTLVELLLASIVFPIIVIGISQAFDSVRKSYTTAKQLNEIYAVLSACPELDRALDFTYVSSATNCSPNNTFKAEGGSGISYSYVPTLTIKDTSNLGGTDPLKAVPDSKVVDITVGYINSTAPGLELRMLITRNGIAQL